MAAQIASGHRAGGHHPGSQLQRRTDRQNHQRILLRGAAVGARLPAADGAGAGVAEVGRSIPAGRGGIRSLDGYTPASHSGGPFPVAATRGGRRTGGAGKSQWAWRKRASQCRPLLWTQPLKRSWFNCDAGNGLQYPPGKRIPAAVNVQGAGELLKYKAWVDRWLGWLLRPATGGIYAEDCGVRSFCLC